MFSLRCTAGPILAGSVALALDAANRHIPYSVAGTGLLDEGVHLAFGALSLLALGLLMSLSRRFVVPALLMSVLIDLDHVALFLGLPVAVHSPGRPVTHSLVSVLVLLLGAALFRRQRTVLLGAAVGLGLHLIRDVMEGPPGVPMLWPASDHAWSSSQSAFIVLVGALVCLCVVLSVAGVELGPQGAETRRYGTR